GHLELCDWPSLLALIDQNPPPSSIAMLTGVFLQPQLLATYPDALRTLRQYGYRIAIDTGWPSGGWTDARRVDALRAFAHCDYVLLNEAEVCTLARTEDLRHAMEALARELPPDCELVAKCGAQGALARIRDSFLSQSAVELSVFDTIGAGDAFNAGYLAERLRRDDPGAALRAGCATAAAIIAQFPRRSFRVGELRP
ncbi:MAG: carbohydrate kinase family protein, partial [Steroidobacteraceae bacterium]